jgi:protein tyrosine phosphatase (PTP) superfamily phosphohydrolase (DUF442 family)
VFVRTWLIVVVGLAVILAGGCTSPVPADEPRAADGPTEMPGLHNVFRVRDDLWSGSVPEGDAGFASLRELGIRTVLSVDGMTPDVTRARAHGLRYAHVPIGYGGVTPEQAVRLAKAAAELPGPIYVHCHHGQRRGPTAAALMCRAQVDGWSAEEARAFLVRAGTDPRYEGLYRAVAEFRPPSAEELAVVPADFPEVADVGGLAARMVEIQDTWDRLSPGSGSSSAELAVVLGEHFREAARLPEVGAKPEAFRSLLAEAERAAGELEGAIRSGDGKARPAAADRMSRQCAACHREYRDR